MKLKTLILLSFFLSSCQSYPLDEVLMARFTENQKAFEALVHMFQEDDGLERVGLDFTYPEDLDSIGISVERIEKYRELFKVLQVSGGIEGHGEKESIYFYAFNRGLGVSGFSKGYVYSSTIPGLVVENLDFYFKNKEESFILFRELKDDWYLYLSYED